MSELKIINGKFIRSDQEVKPEIGNWEQINLLKKYNENLGKPIEIKYDHEEVVKYKLTTMWQCNQCLTNNHDESDVEDWEFDDDEVMDVVSTKCSNCGQHFDVEKKSNGKYILTHEKD